MSFYGDPSDVLPAGLARYPKSPVSLQNVTGFDLNSAS
jgi:hypothetical protein